MTAYLRTIFFFAMLGLMQVATAANEDAFVGSWYANNPGEIELVVIAKDGDRYTLQTFGRCAQGCNSPLVDAQVYDSGIHINLFASANIVDHDGKPARLTLSMLDYTGQLPLYASAYRMHTQTRIDMPAFLHQGTKAFTYGFDTCRLPYVWREASPSDHICTTADQRDQAALDNRNAYKRQIVLGNRATCKRSFYKRLAFSGDTVCVTASTRDRVLRDNRAADVRRLKPNS